MKHCWSFGFVLLVALFVVPESPRWLVKQGQDEQALKILARVNGASQAAVELQEIRSALAQEEGSFAELLRPGDILGSGTVGGGCLLEIREATLGRYLEPGDAVTLEIERLGRLVTPVVSRPDPLA